MFIHFNYPPIQQNKDWKIKGGSCILEHSVPEDYETQHICWAPTLLLSYYDAYWCNSQFCGSWYLPVKRQGRRKRNIWEWGLEVEGRDNTKISCSLLSLFTMYCSVSWDTAELVKDLMMNAGVLVSSAGWDYFIAYLLWWCNKAVIMIKSSLEQPKLALTNRIPHVQVSREAARFIALKLNAQKIES